MKRFNVTVDELKFLQVVDTLKSFEIEIIQELKDLGILTIFVAESKVKAIKQINGVLDVEEDGVGRCFV